MRAREIEIAVRQGGEQPVVQTRRIVGQNKDDVRKGDLVLVTGEIRNRSYEKDGDKRFITEIVMGPNDQVRFLAQNKSAEGHPPATDMDDEIPF
jgi:single-strand DNA-binding protein